MIKFIDMTGEKIGEWTILKRVQSNRSGSIYECVCSCGTLRIIPRCNLVSGKTRSCGCVKSELIAEKKLKHGQSCKSKTKPTKTYAAWSSMITRCTNKNNKSWGNYGGRGVKVCDRWINSFEDFYKDMGDAPINYSLDRIDFNGDYDPYNCRWADNKTQSRNRRNTKLNASIVQDLRNGIITPTEVSKKYGCCMSTACAAKNGINWNDVK